ncbi:hypothetical protein VTJ83DRAFT_5446 [Remersonia thermophila]|uniref:Tubulin-tyrosine ligase n=1 Tax=Remersonia thermophila TaxID=72144 RepID=A0ABR4D6V1_9PEZI
MESHLPSGSYTLVPPPPTWSASSSPDVSLAELLPQPKDGKVLQIMPYESIDFDYAAGHPDTCLINSYVIRKALIRKHFLSATVENWAAKRPESALAAHVKRSESFEVDYAEFLDDALIEAFDLRDSLEKNEAALAEGKEEEVQWWILKPSMSDRGQGIRLFCTMEQLQEIFDGWEVESDEEEEEDDDDENEGKDNDANGEDGKAHDNNHITTSHLRHFVAQPYIHPPLLLPELGNRKFHIRTYVLCVGSLRVYVCRDMLALFAAKPYQAPSLSGPAADGEATDPNDNLDAHLTNTCLQTSLAATTTAAAATGDANSDMSAQKEEAAGGLVHRLSALPLPAEQLASLQTQIYTITGDLFEGAARCMPIHFQPLPQAFEAYGLDFLVDADGKAWLLEVNAFPDFRQTGKGDAEQVVKGFWEGVIQKAVRPFVTGAEDQDQDQDQEREDRLVLVREVDLGRR